MKTVLFQGDSITDCGRNRADSNSLGYGYPLLAASLMNEKYAGEYQFLNRGISGNRSTDLYARIKSDIINLKPDYMSILIGVNDVWHDVARQDGVAPEKFERILRMLLDEVLQELPELKIFFIASFFTGDALLEQHGPIFPDRVAENAAIVKRVAADYGMPCIDAQALFDEACTRAPATYWTAEGVHPTYAGHALLAKAWIEQFEQMR
ncbi:MAG: lysophospholipase [Clostridia bacterium]|nr:lysophospholipase [Clostridia bacterium]